MKEQKTADFIKERYPFYDEDLATRDVELNGEQVQELMQSYSDQQNAGLMSEIERWKSVSELGKKSIRELKKANEKLESVESENAELRERVKELEGALTATLNVARAYDRSRFVDILDKAEKTLKK